MDVDVVLPVLEGDRVEAPDDPRRQPHVRLRVVPVLDAAVRREPPHHRRVLHVHLLEDPLRQLPVLGRLLG